MRLKHHPVFENMHHTTALLPCNSNRVVGQNNFAKLDRQIIFVAAAGSLGDNRWPDANGRDKQIRYDKILWAAEIRVHVEQLQARYVYVFALYVMLLCVRIVIMCEYCFVCM